MQKRRVIRCGFASRFSVETLRGFTRAYCLAHTHRRIRIGYPFTCRASMHRPCTSVISSRHVRTGGCPSFPGLGTLRLSPCCCLPVIVRAVRSSCRDLPPLAQALAGPLQLQMSCATQWFSPHAWDCRLQPRNPVCCLFARAAGSAQQAASFSDQLAVVLITLACSVALMSAVELYAACTPPGSAFRSAGKGRGFSRAGWASQAGKDSRVFVHSGASEQAHNKPRWLARTD